MPVTQLIMVRLTPSKLQNVTLLIVLKFCIHYVYQNIPLYTLKMQKCTHDLRFLAVSPLIMKISSLNKLQNVRPNMSHNFGSYCVLQKMTFYGPKRPQNDNFLTFSTFFGVYLLKKRHTRQIKVSSVSPVHSTYIYL